MSATDPDEPLGGHRFFFSLAQEAAVKANFSVRDNKGHYDCQLMFVVIGLMSVFCIVFLQRTFVELLLNFITSCVVLNML